MTTPVYTPKTHRMIVENHYGDHMAEHLGLCLHVAETDGSLYHYFSGTQAPNRKSSTWWVGKSGRIEQYVPGSMTAWAQGEGNGTYNSVETEGHTNEEFTLFQLAGLAFIYRYGHNKWGWLYQIVHTPGHRGLIAHSDGGAAWGGHPCPGDLRSNERATILQVAAGHSVTPHGPHLRQEVRHFKRTHGLPDNEVIGPRVRALLSL